MEGQNGVSNQEALIRRALLRSVDTVLRLPGLLLFELWVQARQNEGLAAQWKARIMNNEQVSSILEVTQMLQFAQTRNFDHSAAHVLSYSVLLLSCLLLLLPMFGLVSLYLHAISFMLLGFGHYMSVRYVQLELEEGNAEVVLDDFVKLERHGFHFLAQVMIGLTISCLLDIKSQAARAFLAVFGIPIVFRLCGFPLEKLMIAHNVSIAAAMMVVCFYLLNSAPILLLYIRRACRQLREIITIRGFGPGVMEIWRRLHVASLVASGWITFWCLQFYSDIHKRQSTLRPVEYVVMGLQAAAECTASPLSLLGLASAVSYASKYALQASRICLVGRRRAQHPIDIAPLAMGGYSEGLTLVLLCGQTGILGLQPQQRAVLLGVVLFVVISALLQSLYEIFEPQLLSLSASLHASRTLHLRSLLMASVLFSGPIAMVYGILSFMPLDLWSLIILSNCLLTSLQTLSTVIIYFLFLVETRATEPWEKLDDTIFYCKATTQALEFLLAVVVIGYGMYASLLGAWSYASALILAIHGYFNVFVRLQSGWKTFKMRRNAAENMQLLARASRSQLDELEDVCAICIVAMTTEARVTPCGHFFHGSCLRKWLFVKQSCPMCHTDLNLDNRRRRQRRRADDRRPESEEGYSSQFDDATDQEQPVGDRETTGSEYSEDSGTENSR